MISEGHKNNNYYLVSDKILDDPVQLRELAEKFIAAAPPAKVRATKSIKIVVDVIHQVVL